MLVFIVFFFSIYLSLYSVHLYICCSSLSNPQTTKSSVTKKLSSFFFSIHFFLSLVYLSVIYLFICLNLELALALVEVEEVF